MRLPALSQRIAKSIGAYVFVIGVTISYNAPLDARKQVAICVPGLNWWSGIYNTGLWNAPRSSAQHALTFP
jgi:hypothetical protein